MTCDRKRRSGGTFPARSAATSAAAMPSPWRSKRVEISSEASSRAVIAS
jgi:hypothetical protein